MLPPLIALISVLLAEVLGLATLVGTVRDQETAQPLPGAVVVLSTLDRATATDADGRYVLRQVPAGVQPIRIQLIGYADQTLEALVPAEGELEINFTLRAAPIAIPTLDVHGPISLRGVTPGTPSPFPDRVTTIAEVRNHPLFTEPDVLQALGGGDVVLQPETPDGIHIRGGAADQTAFLLDGIPVFNAFHAAGVSSAWNPDAVARLHLQSVNRSPLAPHTLSGSVEAVTREPGAQLKTTGSFSTTQTRFTIDGPVGKGGAGFVVSLRAGLPDAFAPAEVTFVRGNMSDGLAKFEMPAFGGRLQLLGYGSGNNLDAAAVKPPGGAPSRWHPTSAVLDNPSTPPRNRFDWDSRSFGAEWGRRLSGLDARVLGWIAGGEAGADWMLGNVPIRMDSERNDFGFLASLERSTPRSSTSLALRYDRSRTSYQIDSASDSVASWETRVETPVATLQATDDRGLDARTRLKLGLSLAANAGILHADPRLGLERTVGDRVTLGGYVGRTHQFHQSLRNAESVVSNIFPADLSLGSGDSGVPVARSDQAVLSFDWRPDDSRHLSFEAYERESTGLLLVAPVDGAPFTTGALARGSGRSRGMSVEVGLTRERYGILAGYGWQRTRLKAGELTYTPGHGTAHLLEGGFILFPTPSSSIRLGAAAGLGRQTTAIAGAFDWEACNLLDRGCEFTGNPDHTGEVPGGTELPAYLRLDLGFRKRWTINVGNRNATLALFGTVTNLFNRQNVLTYARDPATGELAKIEMRPLSPLVVGLDWRF
ncbi:MAG: TonB-dependent receptor [Candidatus Eisenbacteria bacterium]|nr:TonB-dependent receptor [Candidatus Eisenbacteria bacterium]